MQDERGNGPREMTSNKKKPFWIALACVGVAAVLIAAVIIAFKLGAAKQPDSVIVESDTGGRGTVVLPDNLDDLREKLDQPIEDGYYETRMNVDWVFPSSKEPSTTAYVENSVNNTRTVYFDLTLADTKELIYSSPFIPVGARIEGFTLDAEVPAGEYDGIVTYHLVDDDQQEVSTVSVSVKLRVLG